MRTNTPFSNSPQDLPLLASGQLTANYQFPVFDTSKPAGDSKIARRAPISTLFADLNALVGAGTVTGPMSNNPVAVTATVGGAAISAAATFVTVTSSDANHIVILPAPVVGKELWIHNGATGYELRTTSPTTIAINGGTGSGAESAIAANSTCKLVCVSATAWKGYFMDADGDLAKIEAAAAP